jgi:hypothetical protein
MSEQARGTGRSLDVQEERLRLWQIHLPAALPPAKDIDIKVLADYYKLT